MSLADFNERARETLHTAKATIFLVFAVPLTAAMLTMALPLFHSFGIAFFSWLGILLFYVFRGYAFALQIRARRFDSPPSWEPSLEDRMMTRLAFVGGAMVLSIFVPSLFRASANPWFDRGAVDVGAAMMMAGLWDLYRTAFKD